MLELHVKNTEVQSGTVAISWCTDKATLEKLKANGFPDPKIVLVIAPTHGQYSQFKEQRVVAPFRDGMAYVSFRRKGPQRIYAFVDGDGSRFLRRTDGEWSSTVLETDGSGFRKDWLHEAYMEEYRGKLESYRTQMKGYEEAVRERFELFGDGRDPTENLERPEEPKKPDYDIRSHIDERSATLDIEVPSGAFAKSPPAWEEKWVNHYWSSRPADQCAYRRRRIVAWVPFLQPLGFLLLWIVRFLMALAGLLTGCRGVNYAAVYRPMRHDTEDVLSDVKSSVFIAEDEHGRVFWGTLVRLPFMPMTYLAVLGILVWAYASADTLAWPGWHILWMALVGVIGCFVAVALIAGVGILALHAFEAVIERTEEPKIVPLTEDEEAYLVCGGAPRFALGDLPRERRTVRLRYQALKAKVCQPFSE